MLQRRVDPVIRLANRGVVVYAVTWLGAAAAVVLLGALLLREPAREAQLPAVQAATLTQAVRAGGCTMVRLRDHQRANPPVDGPPAPRAGPGTYEKPPPVRQLTAAMRTGIVVIQYRPGLATGDVDLLARLQRTVPRATIVTPNSTRMPYALAATAYHRYVGCPRADARALDAIRLFQGRYLGAGPGG